MEDYESLDWARSEFSWIQDARQYFQIPFKQIVRTGKNAGKLIEISGVSSDVVVSSLKSDIQLRTNTKYDRISEHLKSHPRAGFVFDLLPSRLDTHSLDSDLQFKATLKGYKELQVQVDGEVIETISLESGSIQEKEITIGKNTIQPGLRRIEVFGFDSNGEKQFRAVRIVKVEPALSSFLKVEQDFNVITAEPKPFVVVSQPKDNAGKGWQKTDSVYTIGDGTSYADNVNSTISVFTVSEKPTQVKFALKYEIQELYDFVSAGYVNAEKVETLFKVQGKGSIVKTFDVPAGQNEIFIKFYSNSFNVAKGVALSEFLITSGQSKEDVVSFEKRETFGIDSFNNR